MERRIIIKFLVKFGKNGVEINQMLQEAYEKKARKETTAFKWVQDLWEGCEDPKDDSISGCPSTLCKDENIDCVHSIVLCDH